MSEIVSSAKSISEEQQKKIKEAFQTMNYGTSDESIDLAKNWLLKQQSRLGPFVHGKWITECTEKCFLFRGNENLCSLSTADKNVLEVALSAAVSVFPVWKTYLNGYKRKLLYNVARNIQKQQSLLGVLESLGTAKLIHQAKTEDVNNLIRSFYHYAGWAELCYYKMPNWVPLGIVCITPDPSNRPLMSTVWHISAALASGNCVIVLADASSCMSLLLLAEICHLSGILPGVFSVLPFESELKCLELLEYLCSWKMEKSSSDVEMKICNNYIFPSFWEKIVDRNLNTRLLNVELDFGHSFAPTVIVLENADMHSAILGILECFRFKSGVNDNYCHILVQDAVKQDLLDELLSECNKLKTGSCFCTGDLVPLDCHVKTPHEEENGATVIDFSAPELNSKGTVYVAHEKEVSHDVKDSTGKVNLKGFCVLSFRTAKEAIDIFNHRRTGGNVCVWTEKLSAALEVAHKLKSGTVWVNCQNEIDVAAGYGGAYLSSSLREGGKSGLMQFMKPAGTKSQIPVYEVENLESFGKISQDGNISTNVSKISILLNQVFKLFYDGAYKFPDGNASLPVLNAAGDTIAYVVEGSMKDVCSAVESAKTAQVKWQNKTSFDRSQILRDVAENLDARKDEFLATLKLRDSSLSSESIVEEIELSIQRLFYWAAYCDKYGGIIQETQLYGKVLETQEPLGVIGIICPDSYSLLAFVSLFSPAIAKGNAVVVIPSEKFPIPALQVCEVLKISDMPAGVVNVISGYSDTLTRHLALHSGVEAIWLHKYSPVGHAYVEQKAVKINRKRLWLTSDDTEWNTAKHGLSEEFIHHATYNKTIWLPMGNIS